jgi:transposase-like protein
MKRTNPNRHKKIKLKIKALYKQGLTLREIGLSIGKSHEFVRQNLPKKLSTLDKN